ncbi:acyl carrier protein [Streptomyces sp. M19]
MLSTIIDEMNLPLDTGEISDDSPLGAGGIDLDSLSLIELTMRLERRFGVEFPDTDIEPVGAMKLGDLVSDVVGRAPRHDRGIRSPERITTAAVRELLSDPKIFSDLPSELDDDTEIALDSLGLVWFLHQLELRHGLVVEPAEAFLTDFTSVRRITGFLADVGGRT